MPRVPTVVVKAKNAKGRKIINASDLTDKHELYDEPTPEPAPKPEQPKAPPAPKPEQPKAPPAAKK